MQQLSYFARVKTLKAEHREFAQVITDRGYPCAISNDLNNGKEYPLSESGPALAVATMRLQTILNDRTKFFIYFIDESVNDTIANVELGIALGSRVQYIILIGEKRKCGFHFLENVIFYNSWESFMSGSLLI